MLTLLARGLSNKEIAGAGYRLGNEGIGVVRDLIRSGLSSLSFDLGSRGAIFG